ncbi:MULTISPECIES: nucleoside triphosphate pyrophosphatase [Rhodococcus]|jgi:septum formation protein|uniref:Nucleoside triphosphate pyrophosphatase n=1 Tax=Rhodococcus aetherivorans TaxID=191292 RepID=A0A059MNQ5_9NOCA|nr:MULTISPECIES: Maf family protein [Rhodococcus]ETT24829.1 Septum formation protein Maf [Rhodococcus rhodochrous ATCC 21198]NCL77995.1 Maf-like protein [Rhodococcus sp. YH1]AKE90706.1 septum formation inhibitor Maf [Rhodococcus aetherivorans]ANZ24544.1 septum formation inhibitor Maf [Rhodococcus sp. WB1]KDE12672.1 septum formation inhibitor Maf [Rhodococcus aetherivorans]
MARLVLASASPARLSVLRSAGVAPIVRVSAVDEDALAAALGPGAPPAVVVTELARAKAADVVPGLVRDSLGDDTLVVGCDSMLLVDGQLQGKPGTVEVARERWRAMAGRSADLLTGHSVLRLRDGEVVAQAADHSSTTVHFGRPTADDLEAYLASGEPLQVAGAFTLDSLGGWFVERIEGDPSSVIGIGLPLVRRLLADVGVSVARLWAANTAESPSV